MKKLFIVSTFILLLASCKGESACKENVPPLKENCGYFLEKSRVYHKDINCKKLQNTDEQICQDYLHPSSCPCAFCACGD